MSRSSFAPDTIPSVLTPDNLSLIRIQYGIPSEYDLELPNSNDQVNSLLIGRFCLYLKALRAGLRLPMPLFIVVLFRFLNISFTFVIPNSFRFIIGLPSWDYIRESVRRAPSLDGADLDSFDKLKVYRASLLLDLLKEQTLFNLDMDAQAAKMLTKGLFTRKRKEKMQNDGSKRTKVGVSSSEVPTSTITVSEVIVGAEIAPTAEVDTASASPVPSMPSGPSSGDRISELPIKKGIGEERKRKLLQRRPVRLA
ncbi:hypothetical protein COCNU_11G003460 [Cocos nucifera]|uniref:Uncharacterized protein n=1 Tax=Cocos nucifera TaxID=13894 RepID=A0A8K0INN2_COCNU|nr:hypothetical protein COCNU_11G003460 [Cocos nucifera]